MQRFFLDSNKLEFSIDELAFLLKITAEDTVWIDMIKSILDKSMDQLAIEACWQSFDKQNFHFPENNLQIGKHTLAVGKKIKMEIIHASAIVVYLCTAGKEIESFSKKLMENGDVFEAYIVDMIGSLAVEKATELLQAEVSRSISNMKHSIRFSPGVCGWNIDNQNVLFNVFEGHPIPVQLNDSHLMMPLKSVSGIWAIGEQFETGKYACDLCDSESCMYRSLIQFKLEKQKV